MIIAFEFFGMFAFTLTRNVFLGEGKVVLVFEIIDFFFDLQVIFYGQMSSIIENILF